MPYAQNVTKQDFADERAAAVAKLCCNQPITDDEVFAICACCNNTKIVPHRLTCELDVIYQDMCDHCRIYKEHPGAFHTEEN